MIVKHYKGFTYKENEEKIVLDFSSQPPPIVLSYLKKHGFKHKATVLPIWWRELTPKARTDTTSLLLKIIGNV